jgi:hypothetical protein
MRASCFIPVGALLILAGCTGPTSTPSSGAAADTAADRLVSAWIAASGGEGVWEDIRDIQYTVTTVWYDAETGSERRRRPRRVSAAKRTNGVRVRVERTEPEGHYVQVWDGAAAWATLDGRRLADTAQAVKEMPHVAGDLMYWIGLPWKLRDPGVRLRHGGTDSGGVEVVEVTFDAGTGLSPGDRYWYYFDAADSAFPQAVHFVKEGQDDAFRERALWRDWRRYGAGTYVGERFYVTADGRPEKALLFSDIVVNAGVRDALFGAPR